MSEGKTTAVVFLSVVGSQRVARAFNRLKREASGEADVYWARHLRDGIVPPGDPRPDLVVGDRECLDVLPERYGEFLAHLSSPAGAVLNQFCFLDPIHMAIETRLPQYHRYVWFIEYDVDFSGSWRDFFAAFTASRADLITGGIKRRWQCAQWVHWNDFRGPRYLNWMASRVPKAYLPVMRLSRRFALAYRAGVRDGWKGHFEVLYPAFAWRYRYAMEDFLPGGEWSGPETARFGAFLPPSDPSAPPLRTYRFAPVVADAYYHERPELYSAPNVLYHPVKTSGSA